jgi:hypothetical protein
MLIKMGAMISSASGSIAGTTASRNRYGQYLRNKSIPVNPDTDRQQVVRAAMAAVMQAWRALTAPQKAAWEQYGDNVPMQNKLGDTIYLPGVSHFIRSNVPRSQANAEGCALSLVASGPTVYNLGEQDPTLAPTVGVAAGLSLAYDDTLAWCGGVGAAMLVYMGEPQNAEINFFGGPYRFVGCVPGSDMTPPESPYVVAAANLPWEIALGQKTWVRVRFSQADGRLTEPQELSTVIVA